MKYQLITATSPKKLEEQINEMYNHGEWAVIGYSSYYWGDGTEYSALMVNPNA